MKSLRGFFIGLFVAGIATAVIAQQPFNLFQVNGTTADTNSGTKSAGTLRMVIATDQPALTNALTVAQSSGTNLHVNCDSGCSSSPAPADESAFTFGTTSQTPIGGVFQTTATNNALTSGQMGAWQFTANRAGFVNLRNASGTEMGTAGNPLQIQAPANATTNVTQWDNTGVAAPDANGYPILTNAATANNTAALSTCEIQSGTGSTASTNSTNCKGSAGNLYAWWFVNTATTIGYVRLYNTSTAPTCSSGSGFLRSIPIPPASAAGLAGGIVYGVTLPRNFGTGISYCITGGSSSTDNTNAPAGIFGELDYK